MDLDEAFSLYYAQGNWEHLSSILKNDITPPTYYIILFYWINLLGLSVFKARLLSLIATSIMISFVWKIAHEFLNIQTAIYSSIILILAQFQFEVGILIRAYPMTELFVILAFYYFLKFHKSSTRLHLGVYTTFAILAINTHTTSLILILIWSIIGIFGLKKQQKLSFILANLLILLSLIPQYLVFNEDKKEALTRWRVSSKLEDWSTMFHEFFKSELMLFVALALILISIYHLIQSKNKTAFKLLMSLFLAFTSAYFISKWVPFFYAKYLLYLYPFLILTIGFGLSKFTARKPIILLSSIGMIIIVSLSTNLIYQREENWKLVTEKSRKYVDENTDIIISPVYMYRPYTYYFDQNKFRNPKELKLQMYNDYHTYFVSKISDNSFDFRKPEKVIFIETHESVTPEGLLNLIEIQQFYQLKNTKIVGSIKIHQLVLRHA
jgi:uncharacterized membrane protein